MSRKIAIVGACMEGFLQLCDLVNNKRYGDGLTTYKDDEYVLIHDPSKVLRVVVTNILDGVIEEIRTL